MIQDINVGRENWVEFASQAREAREPMGLVEDAEEFKLGMIWMVDYTRISDYRCLY